MSMNKPDVIFIELTGVANPEEIADVLTEPEVHEHVRLKQIVTVLDAENVLDYNSFFESDTALIRTLRRQMETADILVLNKTDLINDTKHRKIDQLLRKHNPAAAVIPATHSQLDPNLLLADVVKQERQAALAAASPFRMVKPVPAAGSSVRQGNGAPAGLGHAETPSFTRVQTLSLLLAQGVYPGSKDIEKFLHKLKNRLLRAKGYIRLLPDAPVMLLQMAGNRITWSESTYQGDPYLVFIGINLNEQELEKQWRRMEQK